MDLNFDLHHQWELYLERCRIKEENMPAIQVQETKRAFFGAWGQLLLLFRDDLSLLPEAEGIAALYSMLDQVTDFWVGEARKDFERLQNKPDIN